MKIIKTSLLLLFVAFGTIIHAQNSTHKNYIFIGTNFVDYPGALSLQDAVDVDHWSLQVPISRIAYARYLNPSFAFDAAISIGNVSNPRMGIDNQFFTNDGIGLRYKFTNGYILKESCWFDPYLRIGANYHYYDYSKGTGASGPWTAEFFTDENGDQQSLTGHGYSEVKNRVTFAGSIGFNIWFTKGFGVNWESAYNKGTGPNTYQDFFQHSVGVVFRFGGAKDADKDGVADKDDLCPDVAGLKQFNGCPDTDNDGVPDNEDLCPTVAGEFQGCPDTDKDGVLDKDDKCPNVAGPKENQGCPWPDTDKDGVLDKDDKCPTVAGPKENQGCPWPDTDGDGVLDKDDKCPKVAGPASNNGCPVPVVLEKKDQTTLTQKSKSIYFVTGSAKLTTNSKKVLNNIADLMKKYPKAKFNVSGYTDNTGSDAVNLKISEQRANAVKDYLHSQDVKNTINAKGFGKSDPIASNNTAAGRTQNRRVVIELAQ